MKPHISFSSKRRMLAAWECRSHKSLVLSALLFLGYGDTPKAAYEDYMNRVVYRGGVDVRPVDLT